MSDRSQTRPSTRELYDGIGSQLFAVHRNGYVYATFASTNLAWYFWRGADSATRAWFHIENEDGETVELTMNAHAIKATLDRKRGT